MFCLQYLSCWHKRYSYWCRLYKNVSSEYWKCKAWLTVSRNLSLMYWILFMPHECEISKFYKQCMSRYTVSTFAAQKFCVFWQSISPWILHPKCQNFYQIQYYNKYQKLFKCLLPLWCLLCAYLHVNEIIYYLGI